MKIISRAEAKASGATRYFTNKPCKRGHLAERSTVNGTCLDCLKIKQSSDAYNEARTVRRRRQGIGERPDTSARRLAQISGNITYSDGRVCRNGHKGLRYTATAICVQCSDARGKSEAVKEYRRINSEKAVDRVKAWIRSNPERARASSSNGRNKRRYRLKNGDSSKTIASWIMSQEKVCHWCGGTCQAEYHVDHVFPVSKGGKNIVANMVIACPKCNLTKNARDPVDFAISIGRNDLVDVLESLRSTLQFYG